MNKLLFKVTNGGTLEASQTETDGAVLVSYPNCVNGIQIDPGDFVMLLNYYCHIKAHDIQNDFINPYGKNKEV